MITIFLVDDQPSTRAVLRLRLGLERDLTVIGEAAVDDATVAQVQALAPDIVILDAAIPFVGASPIKNLLERLAAIASVIVLSLYDDPSTCAYVCSVGASALVSKHDPDERFFAMIRATANPNNSEGLPNGDRGRP